MTQISKNVLLIAGSARNVGKTTFICEVIRQNSRQKLVAIKITPHFHEPTIGLMPVLLRDNFRIYLETNEVSEKDSSMFLRAGAETVFYIQAADEHLNEAFRFVFEKIPDDHPIIVESASLRKFIVPGMYLFIQKTNEVGKPASTRMRKLADETIFSDGNNFSIKPESIIFHETWEPVSV